MRIAIVGAGVSGLVAAHLLQTQHEIVVYEANAYAGGHTNTVTVDTAHQTHHVDTGFIVMNDRNYPSFTRLLARLGVATQPTHMSFSVKAEGEDFEYAGTPRGLFCQRRNLLSPRFQRMILDLLGFNTYIFPGGCLPSLEVIARSVARVTDFRQVHTGGHHRALRHDDRPLAGALPGRGRAAGRARLRRALPPSVGAVPELLRGRLPRAAHPGRAAAAG